jgi:hypothetical protein
MNGETTGRTTRGTSNALLGENVKALRLLHQVLMVVSAAVLAFALRPDPSNEYRSALDELSVLREVSFDGWTKFVANRYKGVEEQNEKFVRGVIRDAGLPIAGHPELGQFLCAEQPPRVLMPESRLVDFDAFLSGNRTIGVFRLGAVDRQYMVKHLKELVAPRNSHPSISNMYVSQAAPGGDCRNLSGNTTTLYFQINDQPQTIPNQPVYLIVTYSIVSETGPFAADWLRTDTFGQELIDPRSRQIFPHLKMFWERVSSLTPEQATAFLQGQLESTTHGTLSFFGIPVERSLAVSAGPALCCAILLFLCLHTQHLRRLALGNAGVGNYPWVPLFRGPWGLVTSAASIAILPVAANVELIHRYGHRSELSTQIGAVLTAATTVLALWALFEVKELREQAVNPETLQSEGNKMNNRDDKLQNLSDRIKELGEKSTQVLIFLSFALVVVATLATNKDLGSPQRQALSSAMRWWTRAIFFVLVAILPAKEFRENNLSWYHIIRWLKVVLLWAALICIFWGAIKFIHAI